MAGTLQGNDRDAFKALIAFRSARISEAVRVSEQLLERDGSGGPIVASIHSDVILSGLLKQLLELLLFDPVVTRGHRHYNGYCHENGGAFHPTGLPTMLDHSNY
jgi:hypothetical protein